MSPQPARRRRQSAAAPAPAAAQEATAAPTATTDEMPADPATPIGVGIDTARYGHHATFLRPDLQPAATDLDFTENAAGYAQLRDRLDTIAGRLGLVHFHFRLDVAGAYADNLLAFLHGLPLAKTISCGEPERNKNYRTALFGHKKSDPIESAAVARYALTEKPAATPAATPEMRLLCQVAGRLEAQTRQCTRLVNQLHHLLARVFPELALVTKDLAAGWVLKLLERYPTAAKLAAARPAALKAIPYLDHDRIPLLLEHARASIASLTGPVAEELVSDHVRQVREAHARQKSLEKLLVTAYHNLTVDNHLASIIGIGDVTAAILTAKIGSIDRFETEGKLVGYFGTFPVEASSGFDRDGRRRAPTRYVMCPRGCDLVRRYLYNAALSAGQHNPAVRPHYQRVRAKHADHPAIAVGHAMCKLLRLVFAVWKSGQPFDPEHYPWETPAHMSASDRPLSTKQPAAGHNPETVPERSVVTAAGANPAADAGDAGPSCQSTPVGNSTGTSTDIPMSVTAAAAQPAAASPWIDFGHLRSQLPLARVLEHLGVQTELRGRSAQRRGPCPIHSPGRGRTFSVHLDENVFQCFDRRCGRKGDVIDLWAAVKHLPLREAALELVRTFGLEPAPQTRSKQHGTEKRNG